MKLAQQRLRWRRWTREIFPTISLSLPIMAGMVGQMLMGLTDAIMVGKVGVVPLAAASFVISIAHIPFIFGLGLLSSISVLSSQAFGAQDQVGVARVLRHSVWFTCGIGTVTVLSLWAMLPFLEFLGQPLEVVESSRVFLVLYGGSLLPALISFSLKQFCESLNHPWVPNFIMMGGVVLNFVLNWMLVFGNAGAPALGLEGSGWATLLARCAMALAMAVYVFSARPFLPFMKIARTVPMRVEGFKQLVKLGMPIGLQHLLEVSAFVFAAIMMGWLSAEAIAAHQIAITCAATTFMFPLGIGMAVCIRAGHAWGAGQYHRLLRIGFSGLGLGILFMTCFALVFFQAGEHIASLFIVDPAVIELARRLLLVAAVFQLADGIQIVSISALRGISDVRVPAFIAGLSYWVVAVPTGYLLAFILKKGAMGIWFGLASGLGVAALCLTWRFYHKCFRQTKGGEVSL